MVGPAALSFDNQQPKGPSLPDPIATSERASALSRVRTWVDSYQHSLRALFSVATERIQPPEAPELAAIGRCDIWACSDGAVVLIYRSSDQSISINDCDASRKTINEFLSGPEVGEIFLAPGMPWKERWGLKIENAIDTELHVGAAEFQIGIFLCRPAYQRMVIFGYRAKLSMPDAQALEDFKFTFSALNLVGKEALQKTTTALEAVVSAASHSLVSEARQLLDSADREEEIQTFFKDNPKLIFPEYIECFPKFKLGDDFVTDFVFLIQGQSGLEHVFVELERPAKRMMTAAGQFSADFSQAKNQLIEWDIWTTKHSPYVKEKLPGLFKPRFMLVMDRSQSLDGAARERLRIETQGTARTISTYDDVIDRFEAITKRV